MNDRIKYLEYLVNEEMEDKYRGNFEKYATYRGNGVYYWKEIYSTDTRELFLLGILEAEKIKYKKI